ncbi:MAG TPA: 5-dehydro-4-deoxy-D-glucuronate isomerase [Clostridia bacterium]|nr:5-dehydro-4-deoxy-D-glucuronate isomerase [Clostridia bacterium]
MDTRNSIHPDHAKKMTTDELRQEFLVTDIMSEGKTTVTYSHIDRVMLGGIVPTDKALSLPSGDLIASEFFLEKRELGVFNSGGPGLIEVSGKKYDIDYRDCLYIGRGEKEVSFQSKDKSNPAKFYYNSTPSFVDLPVKKITIDQARKVNLGSQDKCNVRVINQYIHPEVMDSCQLTMGYTVVAENNVWNTMPAHLHERRMEVYFYCDFPKDQVVFHFMGEPTETRHLIMQPEQAAISPSWSIHGGAGTVNYSFIWGMAGENKDFGDMDVIPLTEMK